MPVNTLDPTYNTANFTLSLGNLKATGSANFSNQNTRTVTPFTSGKIYFEFLASGVGGIPGMGVGIENPNNGSGHLGATLYGWHYAAGNIVYNNAATVANLDAYLTNDIICVAVSIPDKKLWFRKTNGLWNINASHNPATNVGGFDLTTLLANNGNVYPGINTWLTGDNGTFNFGATALTYAIPAGFVALDNLGSGGAVAAQARAMVLA